MKLFTFPNLITGLNLLAGCFAMLFALAGQPMAAFVCIIAAAVFDFLDGFAARLFKAYSDIGLQLDSLADMVSFGVAPSVMVYAMLSRQMGFNLFAQPEYSATAIIFTVAPFLLAILSAFRLAKFNIDDRQTTSFIGLPTPANALFWSSLVLAIQQGQLLFLHNEWIILAGILLFSYLLVSEIPMFSLKIKDFSVKKYALQIAFLIVSVVLILILRLAAFPLIIMLYIALSIGHALWARKP